MLTDPSGMGIAIGGSSASNALSYSSSNGRRGATAALNFCIVAAQRSTDCVSRFIVLIKERTCVSLGSLLMGVMLVVLVELFGQRLALILKYITRINECERKPLRI